MKQIDKDIEVLTQKFKYHYYGLITYLLITGLDILSASSGIILYKCHVIS